ncbi:MAG: SBBP repeat-containing protein [Leptolyngbyaceae bacterium]|nr:SBBP repeat-containing protein [Leptolyngbyaceae bacterium]
MNGDRAPNTLSDARNLRQLKTKRKVFNDTLGIDDTTDLLKFKLTASSNVKLVAKKNREDIDLEVFSIKGREKRALRKIGNQDFDELKRGEIRRYLNRVGRSSRSGNTAEKIRTELDEGTYYVRVSYSEQNGKGTKFHLIGTATPLDDTSGEGNTQTGDDGTGGTGDSGTGGSGTDNGTGGSGGGTSVIDVPTWTRQFGSSENDYAYGIDVDSSGHVYVAGTTDGTLPNGSSMGGQDNFVAKYDRSGALLWRRQFGTSDDDIIFDIAVDDAGNYYVAGAVISDVSYSFGGINGGIDGFLAKYSSDGTRLWESQIPLENRHVNLMTSIGSFSNQDAGDAISSIEIDASGHAYVSGFTQAIPQTTQSVAGFSVTVQENPAKAFAAKFDGSTGSNLWITEFSGTGASAAADLAMDASGNVFIAGVTGASMQDDTSDPFISGDALVAKYDASGTFVWSQTMTSAEANTQDYARGIALDASGNVYITGNTDGTLPGATSNGQTDGFVAQYDSVGIRQWVTQFGTSSGDESQAIAIASDGTIFVAGESAGDLYSTNLGGTDTFLATYDTSGVLTQSTQFGTAQDEEAYRLATDNGDRPYLAGQTTGSIESGVNNAGQFDVWIMKNPSLP